MFGKAVIQNKQNSTSANLAGSLMLKFSIFMLLAALQGACATTGLRAGAGVEGTPFDRVNPFAAAPSQSGEAGSVSSQRPSRVVSFSHQETSQALNLYLASREAREGVGRSHRFKRPKKKASPVPEADIPRPRDLSTLSPEAVAMIERAERDSEFAEAIQCGDKNHYWLVKGSLGVAGGILGLGTLLYLSESSVALAPSAELPDLPTHHEQNHGGAFSGVGDLSGLYVLAGFYGAAMLAIPTTIVGAVIGSVSESSCEKKRMKVGLPPNRSAVEREAFDPPGSRMQPSSMEPADELEYLEGKQSLSPREQRRVKRLKRQVERSLKELEQEVDRRLQRLEGRTLDAAEADELRQLERLKQEIELRLKDLKGQA